MKLLAEDIKELQWEIQDSICNLNKGGCMHFAYFFSKKLVELTVEHSIYFVNNFPILVSYRDFNPPMHIMIFISNIGYIDGYSTYKSRGAVRVEYSTQFNYRHTKLSLKKMNCFRNARGWNWMYDTDQNIHLEKLIYKHTKSWQKKYTSETKKQLLLT